jgi:two-component system, OmpR family, KDP operon response regulator KdpE
MPRVLVMDQDPAIRLFLRRRLTKAGYSVQDAEPTEAVCQETIAQFDLLILDLDLPKGSGANLIRSVRDLSEIPVLALSTRNEETAAIAALTSGADDFIRKPFGIEELLARAENALRRRAREKGQHVRLAAGSIEIDLRHRRVYSDGAEIHLPVKEHEVLRALAENADRVVSHSDLLGAVWGSRDLKHLPNLRLVIRALRRKLEPDPDRPQHILTETRIGYCLRTRARATRARRLRSIGPVAK